MENGVELIAKCRGRWKAILVHFGVPVEYLDGKHHPCPVCGGVDRFRFDNQDGTGSWFCGQHLPKQAGYGLQLVLEVLKCSVPEAMNRIEVIVDTAPSAPIIPVRNKIDPRPLLNKLWLLSDPLTGSDMVSKYLHSRGLVLTPRNIRINTSCYEPDSSKRMTAMVARIQNAAGKPISLHRTYLENGSKAEILAAKKIMPGTESLQGSAVRLFSSQDKLFWPGILGIAEGIETAIACAHHFQIATWACISSTLMPSWLPPEQVREVYVFGDNDANYAGQEAAYRLAHILHRKGLIVKVMIPDDVGDFADVWLKKVQKKEGLNNADLYISL